MKSKIKLNAINGITLIALIISIIVLLILAGVTINAINNNESTVTKAQLSSFVTEMAKVEESTKLKLSENEIYKYTGETNQIFTETFNRESPNYTVTNTLLKEIMYIREGSPDDKKPSDYDETEFENIEDIGKIYVIKKPIVDKENTYIWDEKSGVAFKISPTNIGNEIYHSRRCALIQKGSLLDDSSEGGNNVLAHEEGVVEEQEGLHYYEPYLKGFDANNTYVVYYSDDFTKTKRVLAKDYLENNRPMEMEENGTHYYFYQYSKKVWANIVTTANGVEAWWVWIPRYKYKVDSSTNKISVAYTNVNDENLNPTRISAGDFSQYIKHKAFTTVDNSTSTPKTEELYGIWMAKFNAISAGIVGDEPEKECYAPNIDGFDEDNTSLVYYSSDFSQEYRMTLKEYKANNKPRTVTDKGVTYTLYDYSKKIWANMVTTANGVEAWWVWIPRYAYNTQTVQNEKMDIIFVKTDNTPYNKTKVGNKLPNGYTVHKAFTTVDNSGGTEVKQELQGIWMAKFNAVYDNSTPQTDDTNL